MTTCSVLKKTIILQHAYLSNGEAVSKGHAVIGQLAAYSCIMKENVNIIFGVWFQSLFKVLMIVTGKHHEDTKRLN